MAERLKFQLLRHFCTDLGDLADRQLSCQHHTLRAQLVPRRRADVVGNRLLRGDMPLTVRRILSRKGERAEIRQNQRIYASRVELLKIRGQPVGLIAARHRVDRRVHAHAMCVRERDRLRQLVGRKIAGKRAHTEAGASQIHRVRAVEHGHIQFFHVSGGTQQFRFRPHLVVLHFSKEVLMLVVGS